MRKIIAALEVSLDGFIEGPNGETDWIDTWEDPFDLLTQIDACVLGGKMYPDYEQYWSAVLADAGGILPVTGKVASKGEVEYARFAATTPHFVLSNTLASVAWKNTRIIWAVESIRELKQQPGKDIYAVGGAALVSGLMNLGLIDELRLVVHPIVLGGGKALFKDVKARHALTLVGTQSLADSNIRLTYKM